MEFSVPKFIERESKIIGPVSLREFIFLGVVGGFLILLYVLMESRILFYFIALVVAGSSISIVFVTIGGRPFLVVIKNFFWQLGAPGLYLWKRHVAKGRFMERRIRHASEQQSPEPEEEEESPLRLADQSHLRDMTRRVEAG